MTLPPPLWEISFQFSWAKYPKCSLSQGILEQVKESSRSRMYSLLQTPTPTFVPILYLRDLGLKKKQKQKTKIPV